jgi:hypothetical protein
VTGAVMPWFDKDLEKAIPLLIAEMNARSAS